MESIGLLVQEVKQIKDHRKSRGQRYRLHNLLAIIILSVMAGADDYVAISEYCKSKKGFLLKHHLLDSRFYPSHDLFRLVLQSLNKEEFAKLLANWLGRAVELQELPMDSLGQLPQKMIHVDGKPLRASRCGNQHTRSALQVVTAYCSNHSISMGQSIIDKKSCEKTAIPKLLKMIDIRNTLVTIDAIASFKKNAALIIDLGADYLLALKKNNKHFFLEVENFFDNFEHTPMIVDIFQSEDKAHGRIEKRKCQIVSGLKFFPDVEGWKGLRSLICTESQRTLNGKTSIEKRYYVSSLAPNAKVLANAVRKHWTVENELHWSLDVAFNEDRCRVKHKQAAANFAAIRRFALALLKNAKLSKLGIKNQRLQAAWNDEFLERTFAFFLTVSQVDTY